MKHEVVILELLSRIKTLEDEVAELKEILTSTPAATFNDSYENRQSYTKLNDTMIEACYRYGKQIRLGKNASDLANIVSSETGMNRNSAFMYVHVVNNMIEGTAYKRAINATAQKKYYDLILSEYGTVGLSKALQATHGHIEYRQNLGHNVDSIEKICNQYEEKL